MRLLDASVCLFLLLMVAPCSAQIRPSPLVANYVESTPLAQQDPAPTPGLLLHRPSSLLRMSSWGSILSTSEVPCPSADTTRKADRLIIGIGLVGIGIGGVTLAAVGGVGAYQLFTAGEEPLTALGATVGLLSAIIGTIAVRTLIQGVRILQGGDLRIPGESGADPPPPPPLHSSSQSSLFHLSISL